MPHSVKNKYVGGYWPRQVVELIDEIARRESRNRSNCILSLVVQQLQARNENVGARPQPTKHRASKTNNPNETTTTNEPDDAHE